MKRILTITFSILLVSICICAYPQSADSAHLHRDSIKFSADPVTKTQLKKCEGAELIEHWGKFDNWVVREIKESGIIGGATKYAYEIAPNDTIKGNIAYKNPPGCVICLHKQFYFVIMLTHYPRFSHGSQYEKTPKFPRKNPAGFLLRGWFIVLISGCPADPRSS